MSATTEAISPVNRVQHSIELSAIVEVSCLGSICRDRSMFSPVDYTQYWTGFQNNTYGAYCTPKINYGVPSFTCVSSYQCRDYNYITCIAGVCNCNNFQYWDGTMCAPRLNYS